MVECIRASREVFELYHRRRHEIERDYPALSLDVPEGMELGQHWDNMAMLRKASLAQLTIEMKEVVSLGFTGNYIIPG